MAEVDLRLSSIVAQAWAHLAENDRSIVLASLTVRLLHDASQGEMEQIGLAGLAAAAIIRLAELQDADG